MSGHSKWSTIKHKKAKTDAQKGKAFSKVSREITMAAKLGGADVDMNPRLRLALQKAKEANMPNDNIKRAVEKGAGSGDDANLEEILFEAYAPNGVALLINTLTDNRNRTVANVKMILNKSGASLASKGAVSYQFNQKGFLFFEAGTSEDDIFEVAMDQNIEDIDTKEDTSIEIITAPNDLETVRKAFDEKNIPYETAQLTMIPSTTVALSEEKILKLIALIEKLEDDDDVQDVHANFEEE
jgi:YebC/PmpR family DNA-binding regulatory protein